MGCDALCDFTDNFVCSAHPAVKSLERDVLGCDYGGTSWTTSDQADQILASLELESGSRLLEVGSGSGWPALYLSLQSGCAATLLDIPLVALEQAAERARSDDILDQVTFVNGSGTALPFVDSSFDRLSHSDVLCCLPGKLDMLQECRRAATEDARMHFSVIEPAPGLSPVDHEQTVEAGPPFVDVPGGYKKLLRDSGWQLLERIDVTAEYADSLERLATGLKENTAELREAFGAEELREAWGRRENAMNFARSDKLLRFVYVVSA
jgi:SAM-dependent methyltransferase